LRPIEITGKEREVERLGPMEIGLILVIVLIVFGAGKLPQVGEGLGKAIHNFHKARGEDEEAKLSSEVQTEAKSELETTKEKLADVEARLKALEASGKSN
jgi:sec-independent protein translocase protein TatA